MTVFCHRDPDFSLVALKLFATLDTWSVLLTEPNELYQVIGKISETITFLATRLCRSRGSHRLIGIHRKLKYWQRFHSHL